MSIPWCPNLEHVTPDDPWRCGTCGEHGCDLCDDSKRFDEAGEHLCEGCSEKKEVNVPDPINLPSSLTEDAVAEWIFHLDWPNDSWEEWGDPETYINCARAVLALVEAKVRDAVDAGRDAAVRWYDGGQFRPDDIVARVLGREAPCG